MKKIKTNSSSDIYTKRLKNRAALNGAVTVDRSVAIDRIRNSSLGLSQNILKPTESNCSFVYNPSSYGEGKNYVVYTDSAGNDFSFTRATTATVTNKDGSIGDSCYNLLVNSATATTQSVTVSDTPYTLQVNGTGTYTLSGAFSGSLVGNGSLNTLTFTPTSGTLTLTISGTLTNVQLTQSSTIKDYLKTTNRLAVPRIDYSLDLTKPSLLIERQSTNLLLKSEDYSDSAWTKVGSTILSTNNISPSGSANAAKISMVTGTTYVLQASSAPGNSQVFNGSVFLKGDVGGEKVKIDVYHSGIVDNFSPDIILTTNWQRYSFTATMGASSNNVGFAVFNSNSITQNIYMWGSELELGSNATTYIPTTTATVTRNAEASFVDLQNNSLLNQNNFTLFVDGYLYDGSGATRSIALADTTTGGTNDVGFFDGIKASFATSSVVTSDSTSLSSNTAFKIAIQRSGTSIKFFRNGAQIWSTQTVSVVDYRYLIINNGGSTFAINKIELYKETLSDAVLITKTT